MTGGESDVGADEGGALTAPGSASPGSPGGAGAVAGRVVSVNVGLPRSTPWRGRSVRTAIGKQPVEGPVEVAAGNLAGDGQADLVGHGGEHRAVLVYQQAAIDHWASELGRPIPPGRFGENLTVDGLPDDEVAIGDRLRAGTALLEVTQPRVLCYKTGMALGERRMPAWMVSSGRPGFYCRVLEGGRVAAGDPVTVESRHPAALSVREASALLYLPGHDHARLAEAVGIAALSEGWRWSYRALLDHGDGPGNPGLAPDGGPPPAWLGTRPLVVAARRDDGDVAVVELADPGGAPLPRPVAGQHLSLHLAVPDRPGPVVRSYSIAGAPGGRYRLGVKREGQASAHLHATAHPGATLESSAPRGAFALASGDGPVALISAGVGVTPMLAMLEHLADTQADRPVWWVQSLRGPATRPLGPEVDAALARLRDPHVVVTSTAGDGGGPGFTHTGRVDGRMLAEAGLPTDAEVHLCGPDPFAAAVHAALDELGVRRLREETFGAAVPAGAPAPHQPSGPPGDGPAVSFARSGLTTSWSDRHGTLLDLAEDCDVPVRWSCRTGVCHACETPLLAGSVRYDPAPLDPPGEGAALLCCAQPDGPVVVDR